MMLSTGESLTVPLPPGDTVASIRSKLVLLGPDRPGSRTIQHDAMLQVNTRLVNEPKTTVDALFVDWAMNGFRGRISLGAHAKEER
jgi:hypothetical protein